MASNAAARDNPGVDIVLRVTAGLLGGYAFVWSFVTFGIAALVTAGMEYDQAWMLVMLLAFVVFLGVLLWAIAARSVLRVWLTLGTGVLVLAPLGLWLASRLTSST